MGMSKFKATIIVAVVFSIVCFAIMRIYSIPLEEQAILDIIIFVVFILVVAAGKISRKMSMVKNKKP